MNRKSLKFWISKNEKGKFARMTVGDKTYALKRFNYTIEALANMVGEKKVKEKYQVRFDVVKREIEGVEVDCIRMNVYKNDSTWLGSRLLRKNYNYVIKDLVEICKQIEEWRSKRDNEKVEKVELAL